MAKHEAERMYPELWGEKCWQNWMVFSLIKLTLFIMKPKVGQGKTESNKAGSIKSSFFGKATTGMWNILA